MKIATTERPLDRQAACAYSSGTWSAAVTEIINLNKKRKAKARADKETRATENRAKFGRTKQEKMADRLKAEKLDRHLQAHKRDSTDE